MIGTQLLPVPAGERGVDLLQPLRARVLMQPFQQPGKDEGQRLRIVGRAVMIEGGRLEIGGHRVQLIVFYAGEQGAAHGKRIHIGIGEVPAAAARGAAQEGDVEFRVVGHQHGVRPAEALERFQRLALLELAADHLVRDAGEGRDVRRDGALRIDEPVLLLHHLAAAHADRADLRDAILHGAEARCLNIEHDKLAVEGPLRLPLDGRHHVVAEIGLHAVDDLEVAALFMDGFHGVHGIREGLGHAVIGDGDGLVAPGGGALDEIRRAGDAIHARHIRM